MFTHPFAHGTGEEGIDVEWTMDEKTIKETVAANKKRRY
jgi:hypothetical protein